MLVELDNEQDCADFVRLNHLWIEEHFSLEEADRRLAADPYSIVREGGHIFSLKKDGRILGVCALFRESQNRFELARMAVESTERGNGYGDVLIRAAISKARQRDATTLRLLSNTVLEPAIALYRKHGFRTVTEGPHRLYARCNIVMELRL